MNRNRNRKKKILKNFIGLICIFLSIGIMYMGYIKSISTEDNILTGSLKQFTPYKDVMEIIKEEESKHELDLKEIELQKKKTEIIAKRAEKIKKNITKEKIAYLTFDDGPSPVTSEILKILKDYNIKATFFVVGKMIKLYPEILKETSLAGHKIANHSLTHDYNIVYKDLGSFWHEINTTDEYTKEVLGDDYENKIFRFPGGSFGPKKAKFRESINKNGWHFFDWNALNGDAEGNKISAKKLYERAVETTKGKRNVIVLMHDIMGKETTAEFLEDYIKYLIEEGFEFRRLDESYLDN